MSHAPVQVVARRHPDGSVTLTLPAELVTDATLGSCERAAGPVHAQPSRAGHGVFVTFGDEAFSRAMAAAEWVSVRYERALKALADA